MPRVCSSLSGGNSSVRAIVGSLNLSVSSRADGEVGVALSSVLMSDFSTRWLDSFGTEWSKALSSRWLLTALRPEPKRRSEHSRRRQAEDDQIEQQ